MGNFRIVLNVYIRKCLREPIRGWVSFKICILCVELDSLVEVSVG